MLHTIPLLKIESESISQHISGVTTITFFKGDIENAKIKILERFELILKANPWLGAKLVRNSKHERLQLTYTDNIELNNIYNVNPEGVEINSDMSYESIASNVRQFIVKNPKSMINKEQYVTSLTLVEDSKHKSSQFALIFSLSHSVGDGHTYYKLLNMLSNKEDIHSLSIDRKEDISLKIEDELGKKQYKYLTGISHVVNVFSGILFRKPSKAYAFYIDEQKISSIKNNVKSNGEFVSTNDIITSSFSNMIEARITLMAINFRNKIVGLGDNDAGNYEGAILYDKANYENPIGIRNSLKKVPYIGLSFKLPGLFEGMFCKMGLMTNWASFAQEILIDDCEELLHLPITNSNRKMPYEMGVIFRPKAGKLGVLYFTQKFKKEDYISSNQPLGELVSKSIFE